MSNPDATTEPLKPAAPAAPMEPTTDLKTPKDEDETKSDDFKTETDEEDDFFTSIETTEAAAAIKTEQASGHDAAAAPKLLKDAITKGEVDVDESEAEEEKEEEKKGEEHVHHRVSFGLLFCFVWYVIDLCLSERDTMCDWCGILLHGC